MNQLRIAVYYAKRGFCVFPVNGTTKLPLIRNWQENASRDSSTLETWFGPDRQFEDAAIGLAHRLSGTMALDIDKHAHDGYLSLPAMNAALGDPDWLEMQPVPAFKTASGGAQYIFRRRPEDRELSGNLSLSKASGLDLPGLDLIHGYSLLPSGEATPGREWLEDQAPHQLPGLDELETIRDLLYAASDAEVIARKNWRPTPAATPQDATMAEKRAWPIIRSYADQVAAAVDGQRQHTLASVSHKLGQTLAGLGAQHLREDAVGALAAAAPWSGTPHELHTIRTGIEKGMTKPVDMSGSEPLRVPSRAAQAMVDPVGQWGTPAAAAEAVAADLLSAGFDGDQAVAAMAPLAAKGVQVGQVVAEQLEPIRGEFFRGRTWEWPVLGVEIELSSLDTVAERSMRAILQVRRGGKRVLGPVDVNLMSPGFLPNTTRTLAQDGSDAPWQALLQFVVGEVFDGARAADVAPDCRLLSDFDLPENSDPIIDPIIRDQEVTMLLGQPGSGKSMLALGIAHALAGRPDALPLRVTDSRKRNVLVLDFEWNPGAWRERQTQLLGDTRAMDNLYYLRLNSTLARNVEQVKDIVKQRNIDYIIVDSLARACGGDLLGADSANGFWDAVAAIGQSFLVVHHTTKSPGENGAVSAYGSQFFTAYARAIWLVEKNDERVPGGFCSTLRCIKSNSASGGVAPFDLVFQWRPTSDGRTVGISRRDHHDGQAQADGGQKNGSRVMALLREEDGLTQKDIQDALFLSPTVAAAVLGKLLEGGYIEFYQGNQTYWRELPPILQASSVGPLTAGVPTFAAEQPTAPVHGEAEQGTLFSPAHGDDVLVRRQAPAPDDVAAIVALRVQEDDDVAAVLAAEGARPPPREPLDDSGAIRLMVRPHGTRLLAAVQTLQAGGAEFYLKDDLSVGLRLRPDATLSGAAASSIIRDTGQAELLREVVGATLREIRETGGWGYPPTTDAPPLDPELAAEILAAADSFEPLTNA